MYKSFKFPFGVNPYIVLSQYSGTAAWLNSNDFDKASILALGVKNEITLRSTVKAFGKLKKFYEENCLLNQPFVRDPEISIADLMNDLIAKIGENITIKRFMRYQIGES